MKFKYADLFIETYNTAFLFKSMHADYETYKEIEHSESLHLDIR